MEPKKAIKIVLFMFFVVIVVFTFLLINKKAQDEVNNVGGLNTKNNEIINETEDLKKIPDDNIEELQKIQESNENQESEEKQAITEEDALERIKALEKLSN